MALILILLVAAVLAAPQKGSAQNSEYPILGSIAEDLIGLGDLQCGVTECIFEKSAQHTSKVRHQRVELEGGEIFCTQYPQHIQTNFLGIRISRYYEEYSSPPRGIAECPKLPK